MEAVTNKCQFTDSGVRNAIMNSKEHTESMNTKEVLATYCWLRSDELNSAMTNEQLMTEAVELEHFGTVDGANCSAAYDGDSNAIRLRFAGFSFYYACLAMHMAGDKGAMKLYHNQMEMVEELSLEAEAMINANL